MHSSLPSWRSRRLAAVIAAASVLALSACTPSANTGSDTTQDSVTILQPDIGMGLIKEAGPNNTEFLGATQGTLLRKPYVETEQPGVYVEDRLSLGA